MQWLAQLAFGVQSLTLRCRDWGCAPRCRVAPWVCYPTPQSVYVAALLFLCHLIGMPQNRDDNDATLFWHVRAALEICSAALLVDNGDLIGLPVGFPQCSRQGCSWHRCRGCLNLQRVSWRR